MLALVLGCGMLIASNPAGAQTERTYDIVKSFAKDPQPGGRYGDRMITAGDLNGDGINDVWVGLYLWDAAEANLQNVGRVYALDGRTREVIYVIRNPEPRPATPPFGGFGWSLTDLGDIDGDGVHDVGVGSVGHNVYTGSGEPCGTPEPNGCNERQGKAWVFSGADGRLLYDLDNPAPQSTQFGGFGWVGTAGDITGDGISEVLVGAFGNDSPAGCSSQDPVPPECRKSQGQAFIFNGDPAAPDDARLIRTLEMPEEDQDPDPCMPPPGPPTKSSCGGLGIVAQGPGDVDGDGIPDQMVTAWTFNLYTGTGDPCLSPEPNGCIERVGRIYVYSGATGAVIHKIDNPEPREDTLFGLQIVEAGAPGDVTGDGQADIYGNGFVQPGPAGSGQGKSWVFDGETGQPIYELNDPTPEVGGQFGYSLASTFYNDDSVPDLYVGSSPHHVPGSPQSGGTYIFDGRNGALLKALELPEADRQPGAENDSGPQLGRSIAAPGDLNGDGLPDYLAAAPTMNVNGLVDVGVIYAFMSETTGTGVVKAGPCVGEPRDSSRTKADGGQIIVGTSGDDTLVGGPGDDIICGLGGNDVIDAGGGNDQVVGNAGNDIIDGGGGRDQLDGGKDDDAISGRNGNDIILGRGGIDTLKGNSGIDTLKGGADNDTLQGGSGEDTLRGGDGDDVIRAWTQNDALYGGPGDDLLQGGRGTDVCRGGRGRDTLRACENH